MLIACKKKDKQASEIEGKEKKRSETRLLDFFRDTEILMDIKAKCENWKTHHNFFCKVKIMITWSAMGSNGRAK